MVEALTPVEIFCSYAHEDEEWRKKLGTHLSLLRRQGLVSFWHDRLIAPGTDWAKIIDTHLETASVILLLVSADFFASDYCYGIEMKRALEREAAGEARVIPILVRSVDWKGAPFAHLQSLPTDTKPLSVWSDEDTALADITAGIRRVIEDMPLLAASAPRATLPSIWNIPYSSNPFFLGRDDELAQLHSHLRAGLTTASSLPLAISGLGGIGKTQLALEYAYRYHQDYQAVFWARAEGPEALVSSYITIASLLRLPESEAKEQSITVQAVKIWLQTHQDWLLILDNADELTLLPSFLPPSLGGHLLLTTRATATGQLAHRLEIETMQPEQGALFLLRRATLIAPDAELSHASQKERERALQISRELGGLPLALDQAGSYLEETGTSLSNYWRIYQQHRADLLERRGGLVADHPTPVATTWSLSFQRAEEKNPASAELLRLCAFLSPDAIPEEILTDGTSSLGPAFAKVTADAFQFNQAIEALRAYSLVQRNPTEKTLSIHRLVQAVLQGTLDEMERRSWAERAVLAVNAAFPNVDFNEPGTWPQAERLLPQALIAAQIIIQYQMKSSEAGRLLRETASYLQDHARYSEAELLYQHALRIFELGSLQMISALHGLADVYRDQEKEAEAEPLYQDARRMTEQYLGRTHAEMIYPLHGLACIATTRGEHEKAEAFYEEALDIWEERLGETHPHGAYLLKGLAGLYRKHRKYKEAEDFYQRALHIWEQQKGETHPQTAYALKGLADLYSEQSKYAEAEGLYLRALHIREQILGPHNPVTAEVAHALAQLREAQGDREEA